MADGRETEDTNKLAVDRSVVNMTDALHHEKVPLLRRAFDGGTAQLCDIENMIHW